MRIVIRKSIKVRKATGMVRRRVLKGAPVAPDRRPVGLKSVPAPSVRLSEDHIRRLLVRPEVIAAFPEFAAAATALKKRPQVPRGCATCAAKVKVGRTSICHKVMATISSMSRERRDRIRGYLGIRGTMRIEYQVARMANGKLRKGRTRGCNC